jgi:V-type H+-transporting ATPase proteolipid subunit
MLSFTPAPDDALPQAIERAREPLDEALGLLVQIIWVVVLIVVFVFLGIPLLSGTSSVQFDAFTTLTAKIDAYLWAALGIGLVIGLSVVGAGWGSRTCASSILGACIKAPQVKTKNLISVIFCEAVAIYGVIMAIILCTKYVSSSYVNAAGVEIFTHPTLVMHSGYTIFAAGLIVGFGNLVCGPAVGIVGAACVIVDAHIPSAFVKILVIEIFASALGIFSLIVGILVMAQANFRQ